MYKGHKLEKKTCLRDWNMGYENAGGKLIYKTHPYIS